MIRLSNGVEISEDTVISALKKAGISVEPKPKKHIFKAGDVVEPSWGGRRVIVDVYGVLHAVDKNGSRSSSTVQSCNYQYVGRLSDMI